MGIQEKLMHIQNELKAPKNQFNTFGKYKYRNLEDILEGLKPLLIKYKVIIVISDEIVLIGDRHYIKATATINDIDKAFDGIQSFGYAREDESKKGMDLSQLTGSTSSYARKYALNGLFAIDDTKDSDTTNQGNTGQPTKPKKDYTPNVKQGNLTEKQIARMFAIAKVSNVSLEEIKAMMIEKYNKESTNELTRKEYDEIVADLESRK